MTDPTATKSSKQQHQQQQQQISAATAAANLTVNMPILAYSSPEDQQNMQPDETVIHAPNVQGMIIAESGGNNGNEKQQQERNNSRTQIIVGAAGGGGGSAGSRHHLNSESPDKIFDPKPPNLTTMPQATDATNSGPQLLQNNNQPQQPVQNVFQFNVRVNNNIDGGNVTAEKNQHQRQQRSSQRNIRLNSHNSSNHGNTAANVHSNSNNGRGHGGYQVTRSGKSRERRPMSSKHSNQMQSQSQHQPGSSTSKYTYTQHTQHSIPWQNQSYAHHTSSTSNPYFGVSSTLNANNTRKISKKRPQSATRKNLMQGALFAAANSGNMKHLSGMQPSSFKSPQTNFTLKKTSLSRGTNNAASIQTQKQQRMAQYNMHQSNHAAHGLQSSELLSSVEQNSNQNLLATSQNTTNVPIITAAHFQPYNRSMKIQNGANANLNSTTKSGKSAKFSHMMCAPTSIFGGSPDKVTRQLKSKIPQVTLQSREDLYEQNMHTKMQINNLRNENRKINTKLVVLENQLAQKDKLFEDMYKAAFQQVRFPVGNPAQSNSCGPGGAPQQSTPQGAANSIGNNMFHPAAAAANSMSLGSSYGPSAGASQSATIGHSHKSGNIYGVMGSANMTSSNSNHVQAQQLINSYKRTIREQSRELDKRTVENEQIKRSVKMTQINQVLIENETYRKECIRLREHLEQAIWENQQLQKNANVVNNQRQQTTSTTLEQIQKIGALGSGSPQLREESATETFKRDHTSPLRDTSQLNMIDELKEEKDALQTLLETEKIKNSEHISQLQQELQNKKRILDEAKRKESQLLQNQEAVQKRHESEIKALKLQHETELQKLREVNSENIEDNEEIRTLEQQLEVQKQENKELEKQIDPLIIKSQKAVSKLNQVQEENKSLQDELKKNKQVIAQKDAMIEKRLKQAQQHQEMISELEDQKQILEAQVKDFEENMGKNSKTLKLQEAEQKIVFKSKELQEQKNEYEKRIEEQDKLIQMLKQNSYQSPPVAPHEVNRRRSTKTKSQKLNSYKSDSQYGDGDSSFQRADESCDNNNNQRVGGGDYEQDRSDLGFTSNDDSEPLPAKNSQEQVAAAAAGAKANKEKPQWKIQVNDKTVFGPDGLPLSPKEINADCPNVKEGLARLRHACQIHFIRHDSIENYLYGNDYRPEAKLSIRQTKEAAIEKLGMTEVAALDFARFLHEQNGQSISYDETDVAKDSSGVFIDQSRTTQAMKIMLFVVQQVQGEIVYFRTEKEEKMKLIIGEKLQEAQNKTKLLNSVQRTVKSKDASGDQLTFEQLQAIFQQAQFNYDKATMQCCFIFLLKKRQDGDLLRIRKSDLINFIHQSSGKAADFTLTGSKFPLETDLVYSSSEDGDGVPQDKDFSTGGAGGDNTLKSADAVKKVGQSLAEQVHQRISDPQAYKPSTNPSKVGGQPKQAAIADDNYSSDDDFGANDSRSEYSGPPKPLKTEPAEQQQPSSSQALGGGIEARRLDSAEGDDDDDDDFAANDSRSEYSGVPKQSGSSSRKNLNIRSSLPVVNKPAGVQSCQTSDDDFGANDSRSEYSQVAQKQPQPQQDIPEDIAVQSAGSDEKRQYLSQPLTTTNVEDSINDRDLDCSVARQGLASNAPLLGQVPEVEEHKEVTIDSQKRNDNESRSAVEQQNQQPNPIKQTESAQLDTTTGQNIGSLHIQIQKSHSFPPQAMSSAQQQAHHQAQQDQNSIEAQNQHKAIQHQITDLNDRNRQNYSTVPQKGAAGAKSGRKRPMINIDISKVKGQIGRPVNSTKSSAGNAPNSINNALKEAPKVEVGNVEQVSNDSKNSGQQNQNQQNPAFLAAGQTNEPPRQVAPVVQLRPLKEEAPVPFGITVQHESQSEASPEPTSLQKIQSKKSSEMNLQQQLAAQNLLQQNAVTKFDEEPGAAEEEDDNYEMPLAELKQKAPIPLGIKVDKVEHSEYGGKSSIDDYKNDDNLKQGSISSDGLELQQLKKEVPIPVGIKVAQIQPSEYDPRGSIESEGLKEGSVSSGFELAPLKKDVPVPLGIKIAKVEHSEYGGGSDNDDADDGYSEDEDQKAADQEGQEGVQTTAADVSAEQPPKNQTTPAAANEEVVENVSLPDLKQFMAPKITETKNVKVESLRTVSSEEGYNLPSVEDATNSPKKNVDLSKEGSIEVGKSLEAPLPDFPASAVNIKRLNDSNAELTVPPPMSGSKFTNDSFGQGSQALLSAGKPRVHILPPMELLQLKQDKGAPSGIQIGALETDRSHQKGSSASVLREVTEDDSQVELRGAAGQETGNNPRHQAQVTDFRAADNDDGKDSEDYTEDEEEEIPESLGEGDQQQPGQSSPEALKKAMLADGKEPMSEIKKVPPPQQVEDLDSPRQLEARAIPAMDSSDAQAQQQQLLSQQKSNGGSDDIEEDYEF